MIKRTYIIYYSYTAKDITGQGVANILSYKNVLKPKHLMKVLARIMESNETFESIRPISVTKLHGKLQITGLRRDPIVESPFPGYDL